MKAGVSNGKGTLFLTADEFDCSVAVARLAVELAKLQEKPGSAEEFLNQAMDLICQAREVLNDRKISI
jgi:hypothetical protein